MSTRAIAAILAAAYLLAACATESARSPTSDVARPASNDAPSATSPTLAPAGQATGFPPRTYSVDPRSALTVQTEVDGGRQPWRLDPVEVARSTLAMEGVDTSRARFSQTDQPDEPGSGCHRAVVRATLAETVYEVELLQPARQGTTGIWMATGLRRAN